MYNIIKKYADRININDIDVFAKKNNIVLNSKELNIIYENLHNNLDLILNDSDQVFNKIKKDIREDNYNKIYELFNKYKKRYKNYL
ncbi:MAG TPA: hypothetical protein PLV83_01195 [Bacilli bacterium]|nr:hypothetical protein [Bacilli bacterium]